MLINKGSDCVFSASQFMTFPHFESSERTIIWPLKIQCKNLNFWSHNRKKKGVTVKRICNNIIISSFLKRWDVEAREELHCVKTNLTSELTGILHFKPLNLGNMGNILHVQHISMWIKAGKGRHVLLLSSNRFRGTWTRLRQNCTQVLKLGLVGTVAINFFSIGNSMSMCVYIVLGLYVWLGRS